MTLEVLILVGFLIFIASLQLLLFISRYKRCPSDKILVVYGKTDGEQSAKCYAGGATFVWPIIQDYSYLDLTPISIEVNLKDEFSKKNIKVSVPSKFTVGISNKPGLMIIAAERLLGLDKTNISNLAQEIIISKMRILVSKNDEQAISTNREKFDKSIYENVGNALNKIGLELINININI